MGHYLRRVTRHSIYIILFSLILAACKGATTGSETDGKKTSKYSWDPPPAGTVVAEDSMKVVEDDLNNFYFSVRLSVADDNTTASREGFKYNVHSSYGHAVVDGVIVMPYRGEHLRPLLRPGKGYSYIVGFIPGSDYGGDTAFHEYYRITGGRERIEISALSGYTIDAEL
jgi:hypothetical protein